MRDYNYSHKKVLLNAEQVILELEYCFESCPEFQVSIQGVRLGQPLAVVGCELIMKRLMDVFRNWFWNI